MTCIEASYIPYEAVRTLGRGPALIFAPHPDDEVFGCAGAIIRHRAAGDDVHVIIATDGAFGAVDGEYAHLRQQESRQAAKVLGYGEPIFWGLPDRGLVFGEPLIAQIQSALVQFAPTLVYAPSWWEVHPDHTALSLAVTEAVRRRGIGLQLVLYEVGVPLHPNQLLDITDCLSLKQAAMDCFASQMTQQSYSDHLLALHRFRTYTLPAAVKFAEAYRRVDEWPEAITAPCVSMLNGPPWLAGGSSVGSTNQPRQFWRCVKATLLRFRKT